MFVGVVGTLVAVLLSSPLEARRSASCTYEQKQTRVQSVVAYKARMAKDRAAYFTHTQEHEAARRIPQGAAEEAEGAPSHGRMQRPAAAAELERRAARRSSLPGLA